MEKRPEMAKTFYDQLVSGNRVIYVYTVGSEYIGEGSLVFEMNDPDYSIPGRRIYFSRLIVKESHRNQGIGGILVDYIVNKAVEMGYSEISIGVDKVNEVALRLYQHRGFTEIIFDGEDEAGPYYKLLRKLSGKSMIIDYSLLAEDYDLTRTANINIINLFAAEIPLDGKTILDFGCGTGNYANVIKKLTTADIYGVEPSENMREMALAKGLDIRTGDHANVPFEDAFFDFIFMTDVIHHVPDMNMMFSEFYRVLKPGGLICILTESHQQLETRFWVRYFPTTVAVEKQRYPDIPEIIEAAISVGLEEHRVIKTDADSEMTISEDFIKLVEKKGFSMFRLIDEADYKAGFESLKKDYENKLTINNNHGETLLWLRKGV
jgi:ubiquinone/menaquinone biosynthesis C-methylase UbiE/GNAT superfamily N-acetyltransferase